MHRYEENTNYLRSIYQIRRDYWLYSSDHGVTESHRQFRSNQREPFHLSDRFQIARRIYEESSKTWATLQKELDKQLRIRNNINIGACYGCI
jgi:transposase